MAEAPTERFLSPKRSQAAESDGRDAATASNRARSFFAFLFTNPLVRRALVAVCVVAIVIFACLFHLQLHNPGHVVLTDFNDFAIVGQMVLDGRGASAYDWNALKAEQLRQTGSWAFMPWAYPPQFTLLTATLGSLPIGLAYLLYIGGSFALFYTALRRLCGEWAGGALAFALPAVLINAKCGQNGFLVAGLIGWFLVAYRERSSRAGWPLGAMLIKPHLAVAIAMLALLDRRWKAIVLATTLVVTTSAIATVALSPEVWPAFLAGTSETGQALFSGHFPLERMTSVFAALHRFGTPPAIGMALHAAVAVLAMALLAAAWFRGMAEHRLLALAVIVSTLVSPYTYDYDMIVLAFAAGLLLPDFVTKARPWEQCAALLLAWITISNYLWIGFRQIYYGVASIDWTMGLWTISPITLFLLIVLSCIILSRPARAA